MLMMHAQLLQSCPTLCDPMDCSTPGSSVHGILQPRILKFPFPSQGDLPDLGIEPTSYVALALEGSSLPLVPPGTPSSMFISFTKFASLLFSLMSSHGVPVTLMLNLFILSFMSVHFFFTLFIAHSFLSKIYQFTNTLSIFI